MSKASWLRRFRRLRSRLVIRLRQGLSWVRCSRVGLDELLPASWSTRRPGHLLVGAMGERLAALWVRRHGAKVLYRNYRGPGGGELDLVLRDGQVLVFMEVKTRSAHHRWSPHEAVDLRQRRLIRAAARHWCSLLTQSSVPTRHDIMEVWLVAGDTPRLRWLRDAFGDEARAGRPS